MCVFCAMLRSTLEYNRASSPQHKLGAPEPGFELADAESPEKSSLDSPRRCRQSRYRWRKPDSSLAQSRRTVWGCSLLKKCSTSCTWVRTRAPVSTPCLRHVPRIYFSAAPSPAQAAVTPLMRNMKDSEQTLSEAHFILARWSCHTGREKSVCRRVRSMQIILPSCVQQTPCFL